MKAQEIPEISWLEKIAQTQTRTHSSAQIRLKPIVSIHQWYLRISRVNKMIDRDSYGGFKVEKVVSLFTLLWEGWIQWATKTHYSSVKGRVLTVVSFGQSNHMQW